MLANERFQFTKVHNSSAHVVNKIPDNLKLRFCFLLFEIEMENTVLFQCHKCEFTALDETIVVNHLQVHETAEQRENASFYNDAYAVTECTSGTQPGSSSTEVEDASSGVENASWSDDQTKLLISLYKEKKPLVEEGKIKTMKKMWERIREEMIKINYFYSIQQLENKWKSLERSYKTVTANKKKTGRGRKSCPYERELGEILNKRHSINPVCVLESSTSENVETSGSSHGDNSRSTTPESSNKTPRRSNASSNTIVLHELQQLRLLISESNEKKEQMEKKKYEQREEILNEIRKKNELLQKLLDRNN